jgi:hypothetical protein
LGKKKPALYYAWGEEYYENPKNAGKLHKGLDFWNQNDSFLIKMTMHQKDRF